MKYRFCQLVELVCSLIDWVLDQVDPLTDEETIESIKQCPVSVQKAYLESCLKLEYRVKRNAG